MILDLYLFNLINGLAGRWPISDALGIFFARYFEYVLLVALLLFLVKDYKKNWRMVAEALVAAVAVRFFLAEIIRIIYFRARPFVHNSVNLLIHYNPEASSFPSGHASFYFALSTIIFAYHKKAGIFFYIGSALIVLGRVFVGIHWPSDILGGAVLGICMGLILNYFFKRFHPLRILERFI